MLRVPGTRVLVVRLVCLGLFVIPVLPACARKPDPVAAARQDVGAPLTDEEVEDLGRKLKDAVARDDKATALALVDWNVIIERAIQGAPVPSRFLKDVRKGMESRLPRENTLTTLMDRDVSHLKNFVLLNTRREGPHPHLIFRTITSEGALNYLDFEVARRPDGLVKAVDITPYLAGEPISTTMQKLITAIALPMVENNNLLGVSDEQKKRLEAASAFGEMANFYKEGRYQEMMTLYDNLPADLKAEKASKLLRLQAAQELDTKTYNMVMEDVLQSFPDDRGIDLISIDLLLGRRRYDEVFKAIDHVEKNVGGDPYLDVLRSNVLAMKGEQEKAREAVERAIEAEPSLEEAHTTLLDRVVALRDHPATLKCLRVLRDEFGMEFLDLSTVEVFGDFVKSPEYQEWKKEEQERAAKAEPKGAGDDSGSRTGTDPVSSRSHGFPGRYGTGLVKGCRRSKEADGWTLLFRRASSSGTTRRCGLPASG